MKKRNVLSIDKDKSSNNIYKEYSSLLEMDSSSFATGKNEEFKNLLNTIQNIQNNEKNEKEEIKYYDKVLEIIDDYFTNENYNLSKLDNGKEEIIALDKMIITLTTTQNQNDKINSNMTVINLGECENLLRETFNITNEELLYIKKLDIQQEGMKIPKVE